VKKSIANGPAVPRFDAQILFIFNHLQIYPHQYCTLMATSIMRVGRCPAARALGLSRPFRPSRRH